MRIALIGAPGSGQAVLAKLLSARYRVPQISLDDLRRKALAGEGKLDDKLRAAVKASASPGDDVLRDLLDARLRARDTRRGFIIDDYPQNIPQAQALDTLLGMLGWSLQVAVHIKLSDAALLRRITGRMQCGGCEAIYNRHFSPPKRRNKCDSCGGKVVASRAGKGKILARRIAESHETIAPLLAYYKAQHKLRTVAAEGLADEVHQKICDIVDLEIRPLEIKTLETAAQTHAEEINTIIAGGEIHRIASPDVDDGIDDDEMHIDEIADTPPVVVEKEVVAKPVVAKKKPTPVKKPATKKSTTKSVTKTAKKKVVKKKPTPKTSAIKKKASAKKTSAKKPIAKKATTKKSVAKKTVAGKAVKKSVTKKKVAKKKPTSKTSTIKKKTPTKKSVAKKTTSKKPTAKKTPAKKSVTKKSATKKPASKKTSTKKSPTKKTTKKK